MSIRKDVWVRCDKCSETGFASHTSKQARREARKYGWVFRNGKDYCPNCAPTKRVLDASLRCASDLHQFPGNYSECPFCGATLRQ